MPEAGPGWPHVPFDLQGHRGARGLAPESTVASFDAAIAHGVTGIEFDVRLTGDGREATVFYTDLGRSLDGREADAAGGVSDTATALESAKGLLRTTIGQQLGLKFTPTLTFVPDASEKTAQEMEDLLARVQAADAELAKEREGSAFAGEADPYKKPVEPADE